MGERLRHGLELRVLGLGLRPAVCVLPECLVSATLGLGRRRRPEDGFSYRSELCSLSACEEIGRESLNLYP